MLLADYLVGAKLVAGAEGPGALRTYLECLEYGLALYFKFAGFSDIAIVFALLLGNRLPENFEHPFFARNIGELWKHWQASVSA